jgi:hypothetical protein
MRRRIAGMSTEKKKFIYPLAVAAAIVATPAAFASAATDAPSDVPSTNTAEAGGTTTTAALATPGTHYVLVDANGNVVGELVSESATQVRLRVIGVSRSARAAVPAPDPRSDRTFHPDYSKALTPGQMGAAWQAEMDRLFPQPATGGG